MEKCAICKSGLLQKIFVAHSQDYSSAVEYNILKCGACGCGFTSIGHFAALQEAFGHQADDIAAALNNELPGQDEGEEWKNS